MTANELADAMEEFYGDPDGLPYLIGESAAMLRQFGLAESIIKQQQLEIEVLKEQLEDCTCQGGHSEAYLKAKGKLK